MDISEKTTEKFGNLSKEEFVFLIASSDVEYKLICQRLREAGIKYRVLDRRMRGARFLPFSESGWHIFAQVAQLEEAKKLLNLA
ncbi:hypothetical protein A2Y83_02565 [Candidatus Falkowbacteria bacterium RBG_13_39_14]|uniref:Uncharacterized protein n=1 Tax=Candidatus Falkowbacteria bacterium RBG_13_39_14 TaxID=1797985 RepID=A0A1F5S464_9BACT|nr:MAG: hypothetical protein A2Y83_02565 [Candidatus Falkowbacteria bacterium RBG_13_39_14]